MRKIYALALIAALLVTGCSSVHVKTDFDRSAEFSRYATYSWLPHKDRGRGMMRSQLIRKHVVSAVDGEMARLGFRKVNRERADILVNYFIGAKNKVDVTHYGYRYGPWGRYRRRGVSVHRYKEGSLILDFVDRESMQLVWRGWASSVLHGRENIAEDINRSVTELLRRYPPEK
ncbi:MAG: DUF4136 domain-containing protein [Candidatus Latescibacteria bacterium]|nr:DUF4136 domain-containing protein [Candidatus Latescibacterota bacterium]